MPRVYSAHYNKMSISITQEWVPDWKSDWAVEYGWSQRNLLRGVNLLWGCLKYIV